MANVGRCVGPEELSVLMDLLSHDILNKNQATLSYLELIHWQPGDEKKTKGFAELAASQVKASSMLLDSVRRFIDSARRGEMPAADVSLPDMFASVVEDISSMFPFKRVTVDASGVAAGARVQGGQCVQDLFMNLLVNLVQLSPEEEAAIVVKARKGSLGGAPCWHVTVASGTAVMPQGVGDSVFARLAPPDTSKMARVSGAAFAGSIARALGGTFGAHVIDTERNAGCAFDVSLKGADAP